MPSLHKHPAKVWKSSTKRGGSSYSRRDSISRPLTQKRIGTLLTNDASDAWRRLSISSARGDEESPQKQDDDDRPGRICCQFDRHHLRSVEVNQATVEHVRTWARHRLGRGRNEAFELVGSARVHKDETMSRSRRFDNFDLRSHVTWYLW